MTRDRELLKRRSITHGCYVHALKPAQPLREIFERLDLSCSTRPFTLCLQCNAPLRAIDKSLVLQRLPPRTRAIHQYFSTCDVCQGVFWQGSHWQRMRTLLDQTMLPPT